MGVWIIWSEEEEQWGNKGGIELELKLSLMKLDSLNSMEEKSQKQWYPTIWTSFYNQKMSSSSAIVRHHLILFFLCEQHSLSTDIYT
jgi:hypothetical protein